MYFMICKLSFKNVSYFAKKNSFVVGVLVYMPFSLALISTGVPIMQRNDYDLNKKYSRQLFAIVPQTNT